MQCLKEIVDMSSDKPQGQHVPMRLGVTANSFGQQCPTICALIDSETADEATRILAQAIPAAEAGLLPNHPFAEQGRGVAYDVRLYGCMRCGDMWSILGPRSALGEEFVCPMCAPGTALSISELHSQM